LEPGFFFATAGGRAPAIAVPDSAFALIRDLAKYPHLALGKHSVRKILTIARIINAKKTSYLLVTSAPQYCHKQLSAIDADRPDLLMETLARSHL
jgi:hypothetical protein